jgi:hypothetical protein
MGVVVLEDSRHHERGPVSAFGTGQEEERKCFSMFP